jgi:nicotinamide phosphoribosyltransferase
MTLSYNPILDTDSYKVAMWAMLPEGLTRTFSYGESRGGVYPATVFFGLQPYLRMLADLRITPSMIEEAAAFYELHGLPFNRVGWTHIAHTNGGRLPVRIRAVPEGTLVPTRNVMVTVENTDPAVPWLTTWVETALLRAVWYATTVATRIHYMKERLTPYFEETSDGMDMSFALLDFSARGCSSYGSNEIGGAAYLTSFMGSDSVAAIRFANHHYDHEMSGFSVPATEHSIMCSWGQVREAECIRTLILRLGGPGKIVSIVGDTWDVYRCAGYCADMSDWIKSTGTTLVFRPDSGDMEEVIARLLIILGEGFGATRNTKGYLVLNGVKILWGDGINEDTCTIPFQTAMNLGFSADSIIVGSGGGLMQSNIDRDTCKFAFKASAVEIDGDWEGIAKDPVTDAGKRSKKGRIKLIRTDGVLHTEPFADTRQDILQTVYEDGFLYNPVTLDSVRALVKAASE